LTLHFLRCSSNCPIAELLTAALCTALRTTIGSRPRREGSNLRELPTKRTRTAGSRNVLPRLLTNLQAMWLLDIRERPKENYRRNGRVDRVKRVPPNSKVRLKPNVCVLKSPRFMPSQRDTME